MKWKLTRLVSPAWCVALGLCGSMLLAGCYVKVNKAQNGESKDVDIHSPLGGIHVRSSTPTADDLGLPAYPSATPVADKDGGDGADVHVGFGDFQLRVTVAKYATADAQTKVESFYRTALARYGEVLECRGGHAVGAPATTHEGLSCSDQGPASKGIHIGDEEMDVNLRAGSRRHQHIVGFSDHSGSGTRFALVRLDLPAGVEQGDNAE